MDWYRLLFLLSLNHYNLLLSHKSDMIFPMQSWMTKETFSTLIRVSLNSSRCSTINIYGVSKGTDELLDEFIKIYPRDYVLNDTSRICGGYFIITKSVQELVNAMKFIPPKMATPEMLIIFDNIVVQPTRLFNASMYENANVNIAAHIGMWTLTKNYLKPRIFKEVSRPEEMIHETGMVNLKGRELRATTFYHTPFSYLKTTINRSINGIKEKLYTARQKPELDGIVINLFLLLVQKLNATWTVRTPNDFYKYGIRKGNRWHGGTIGQLVRKEVDIGITTLGLKQDMYEFVNMTEPYAQYYIHFLVPRPKQHKSMWALAKPFRLEVWAVLIFMLITVSLYIYARARLSPKRVPERYRSFKVTLIELLGRLLNTTGGWNIQGLRLEFQLWYTISLLLITAYSSNLAARLAAASYEKRVDTAQDFIEANLTWGRPLKVPLRDFFGIFDRTDPYAEKFPNQYEHEKSINDVHEKISRGNYAIYGTKVGSMFFPENEVTSSELNNYRLMKLPVASFWYTFAVQPSLLKPVDKITRLLRETGFVEYHLRDVVGRRSTTALREVLIEHEFTNVGPTVLTLIPLSIAFSLLIVGLLLSTIVYVLELRSASKRQERRKTILQVLADVKKERETSELEISKKELKKERITFLLRQLNFNQDYFHWSR